MKRWMTNGLIAVFACIFLVSAFFLVSYYIQSRQAAEQFEHLQGLRNPSYVAPTTKPVDPTESTDMTESTEPSDPDATVDATIPTDTQPEDTTPAIPEGLVEITNTTTGKTAWMLPEFAQLYQLNSDIIGWISISGTPINYPVMQTPGNPDYYLQRDYYGKESRYGCIYAREACDLFAPSDNVTLYGHMMKDNSMFGYLDRYIHASYRNSHPYIQFDTLTEHHTYEVFAVFKTSGTYGEGFAYHLFDNARDEAEFNEFVATCKDLALYDSGITAQYGDKLLTLSTCDYSVNNGRLVVVAKRIS